MMETPPPFNPSERDAATSALAEPSEQAAEPSSDSLESMALDADTARRIADLIADAEARGYLRGRNEQIEATQHFDADPDLQPESTGLPRYCHRSVWD